MNWVIIADEVSALGWRLAGATTFIAGPESVQERFIEARQHADLLFITADLAQSLPNALLDTALLAQQPLVVVVPTLTTGGEPPDLERQVKRVLGVAA